MVLAVEVDRHAMVATDKSRIKGIIDMPTTVLDPPRVGGVKAVPETSKQRPQWNAGIVVGKAIDKVSVGRRMPIRTNLDQAKPNREIGSDRTLPKARTKPEQPSLCDEAQVKIDEDDIT